MHSPHAYTCTVCTVHMNICSQVNLSPPIEIDRCVGRRDGEYDIIAYVDASKDLYGVVVKMN